MSGVAYTGTGEGYAAVPSIRFGGGNQSPDGHIVRQTKDAGDGAIDGGLLPLQGFDVNNDGSLAYKHECSGYRKMVAIYVFAHGATSIKVVFVDQDGFEHVIRESTTETLVDDLLSDAFLYNGWQVKVVADSVGANGAKVVAAFDTWFNAAPFVR